MRISPMSVYRNRLRTALPKEPVPPVIIGVDMKTFENKILGSYQKLVVSKLIEVAKNMPNTPHIKPKAIDIN
jgi:hypothetical protein